MNTPFYPLVSIITPAYNQADYLAETIESILSQDYPNIEYIVLDDGSTDHTKEVLKKYDGKLRWESHQNIGQASTLNKGWAMSKGEIIAYLSSDDYLAPDAVSNAVKALIKCPEIAVTYSDYFLVDAKSRVVRKFQAPDFNRADLIENLICHPGPGAFFRRDVFDKAGGWNPILRQIPDFDFWLRASAFGNFLRLPIPLAYSRIHETSQSFAKTSIERAEEPVYVVMEFWKKYANQLNKFNKNLSVASAYLLTARLHLISSRFKIGGTCLIKALQHNKKYAFTVRFWRATLVALVRRLYY